MDSQEEQWGSLSDILSSTLSDSEILEEFSEDDSYPVMALLGSLASLNEGVVKEQKLFEIMYQTRNGLYTNLLIVEYPYTNTEMAVSVMKMELLMDRKFIGKVEIVGFVEIMTI